MVDSAFIISVNKLKCSKHFVKVEQTIQQHLLST